MNLNIFNDLGLLLMFNLILIKETNYLFVNCINVELITNETKHEFSLPI